MSIENGKPCVACVNEYLTDHLVSELGTELKDAKANGFELCEFHDKLNIFEELTKLYKGKAQLASISQRKR